MSLLDHVSRHSAFLDPESDEELDAEMLRDHANFDSKMMSVPLGTKLSKLQRANVALMEENTAKHFMDAVPINMFRESAATTKRAAGASGVEFELLHKHPSDAAGGTEGNGPHRFTRHRASMDLSTSKIMQDALKASSGVWLHAVERTIADGILQPTTGFVKTSDQAHTDVVHTGEDPNITYNQVSQIQASDSNSHANQGILDAHPSLAPSDNRGSAWKPPLDDQPDDQPRRPRSPIVPPVLAGEPDHKRTAIREPAQSTGHNGWSDAVGGAIDMAAGLASSVIVDHGLKKLGDHLFGEEVSDLASVGFDAVARGMEEVPDDRAPWRRITHPPADENLDDIPAWAKSDPEVKVGVDQPEWWEQAPLKRKNENQFDPPAKRHQPDNDDQKVPRHSLEPTTPHTPREAPDDQHEKFINDENKVQRGDRAGNDEAFDIPEFKKGEPAWLGDARRRRDELDEDVIAHDREIKEAREAITREGLRLRAIGDAKQKKAEKDALRREALVDSMFP